MQAPGAFTTVDRLQGWEGIGLPRLFNLERISPVSWQTMGLLLRLKAKKSSGA